MGKILIIIRSNVGTHGVTEHQSLMTRIDTCVDTGYTFGKNSHISTGDMGISLVWLYIIISKESSYKGTKTKLIGAIYCCIIDGNCQVITSVGPAEVLAKLQV